MTELQAELLLKQAARIEVLEERVEALNAALRLAINWLDEDNVPEADYQKICAGLAPEQERS